MKTFFIFGLLICGFVANTYSQWWPPNVKVWGQIRGFADRRVFYKIVEKNRELIWGFGVTSEEIEIPNKVYSFRFICFCRNILIIHITLHDKIGNLFLAVHNND